MKEQVTYMGHHWIQIEGDTVVVGVNEEALNEIDSILKINFPEEGEEVSADEPCGDIDTNDGNLNIYSPINGTVSEVNADIRENPNLIFEDPTEEGWLLKIQAADESEIDQLLAKGTNE